jgi:hypothetical protein
VRLPLGVSRRMAQGKIRMSLRGVVSRVRAEGIFAGPITV